MSADQHFQPGHPCAHCGERVYLPSKGSRIRMGIPAGVLIAVYRDAGGRDGTACVRPEGHEIKEEK